MTKSVMKPFTLLACIAVLSFLSVRNAQNSKANNCPDIELQELQVIFIRLEPGSEVLSINDKHSDKYKLERNEVEQLRAVGLKGKLNFNSGGVHGELVGCKAAKQARVVVVGQSQIKHPVELHQPDGVSVILSIR